MGRKNDKKKKKKHVSGTEALKGTLDVIRSGVRVVVTDKDPPNVLVRPNDFDTALHGDTVMVELAAGTGKNSNRRRGIIVEVLERKQAEFIGHLELSENFAFFIPETDNPMPDVYIPL